MYRSYVTELTGPLPVDPLPKGTCAVSWGHLIPVTDPPVLIGTEPFDPKKGVVVLHVPDIATLKTLQKVATVKWAVGSTEAHAKAAAHLFTWPKHEAGDPPVLIDDAIPIIVGGDAPTTAAVSP